MIWENNMTELEEIISNRLIVQVLNSQKKPKTSIEESLERVRKAISLQSPATRINLQGRFNLK